MNPLHHFGIGIQGKRPGRDHYGRNYKCPHCNEDLGQGDSYDLAKDHIWSCRSKVARDFRKANDEEKYEHGHSDYE